MTLEDSINLYHTKLNDSLIDIVLHKPQIIPSKDSQYVYRTKDDSAHKLTYKVFEDGVPIKEGHRYALAEDMYNKLHWEAVKRFGYGMLNTKLPNEIAEHLTAPEALYFYAGVWAAKSSRIRQVQYFKDRMAKQTLYQNIRDLIELGMEKIRYEHNKNSSKKRQISSVPFADEIRSRFVSPKYDTLNKLMKSGPDQRPLF